MINTRFTWGEGLEVRWFHEKTVTDVVDVLTSYHAYWCYLGVYHTVYMATMCWCVAVCVCVLAWSMYGTGGHGNSMDNKVNKSVVWYGCMSSNQWWLSCYKCVCLSCAVLCCAVCVCVCAMQAYMVHMCTSLGTQHYRMHHKDRQTDTHVPYNHQYTTDVQEDNTSTEMS